MLNQDSMSPSVCVYIYVHVMYIPGPPWWLSSKESAYQYKRHRFSSWVRKIPWRRKWQPASVFLPGKSHEQRSLADYSTCNHKRVGHGLATKQQQWYVCVCVCMCVCVCVCMCVCTCVCLYICTFFMNQDLFKWHWEKSLCDQWWIIKDKWKPNS